MSQTVFVVDDDCDLRWAISELLQSVGMIVECFSCGQAFLDRIAANDSGCVLLDIRMPRMNGLQVQQRLLDQGNCIPIIFATGHGDIKTAVSAMKLGAFDFIAKPFHEQDLIDLVHSALAFERKNRVGHVDLLEARRQYATLDRREKFVMGQVVAGAVNRCIASDLGLSEITVKLIRRRVMRKMEAGSLASLIHSARLIRSGDAA